MFIIWKSFHNLKNIVQAKGVTCWKKDSSVVKLNKKDHIAKIEKVITQGISGDTYVLTGHNTIEHFKSLKQFLNKNLKN